LLSDNFFFEEENKKNRIPVAKENVDKNTFMFNRLNSANVVLARKQ